MPGDFLFYFTKGRSYFAGTEELNLEARGVTLDVRVPITEKNEQAKQAGRDVVLEAAVVALGREANRLLAERLPGTTWKMSKLLVFDDRRNDQITVENPEAYTITFGEAGAMFVKADCNQVNASYDFRDAGRITVKPGAATVALCADNGLGEQFLRALGDVNTIQTDGKLIILSLEPEAAAEGEPEQKYAVIQLEIADGTSSGQPAN